MAWIGSKIFQTTVLHLVNMPPSGQMKNKYITWSTRVIMSPSINSTSVSGRQGSVDNIIVVYRFYVSAYKHPGFGEPWMCYLRYRHGSEKDHVHDYIIHYTVILSNAHKIPFDGLCETTFATKRHCWPQCQYMISFNDPYTPRKHPQLSKRSPWYTYSIISPYDSFFHIHYIHVEIF